MNVCVYNILFDVYMCVFDLFWKKLESIEDVLSSLHFAQRLPISIPVLALLVPERLRSEELLVKELIELGCRMRTFNRLKFLIFIPAKCLQFSPSMITEDQVRDAVVSLQNWRPFSDEAIEQLVPQKNCRELLRSLCVDLECKNRHFFPIIKPGITDINSGLCSYLDLCKNNACKFIHVSSQSEAISKAEKGIDSDCCLWIQSDVRTFPFHTIFEGINVGAVLIDPPWDIHMELSYGTLTDDEMRSLDIPSIQPHSGFIFVWATSRTVEVARDCLRLWGYARTDEIIWLKTNQVGGTVRSGRTGHWLNHNKEHCLVGVKGDVSWANVGRYRQDCDVIVAPVRENSRKPDEIYSIIERIVVDGRLCVELFGRNHNRRSGWLTIGNQVDGTNLNSHPELHHRWFSHHH